MTAATAATEPGGHAPEAPRPTPAISVVVCSYTEERWEDLVEAVRSIHAQTVPAHELIVVCDHNPSLLRRAEQELGGARFIANRETRGLSGARNSGVATATGDIVAFLDDDAAAAPDWLAQLIAAYSDPTVAAVGGTVEPRWDNGRPKAFPDEFDWVVGCTYRGLPDQRAPVRNPIGANVSFRREIFGLVGGFTTGIGRVGTVPLGCEETELCIRLRQHSPDAVILYEPRARVSHRVTGERATWRYFASRCLAEGRSKAAISRLVGAGDGLASERSYTLRTLPLGVLRGLAEAARGDVTGGLGRAGAIFCGLVLTTAGYLGALARGR